MISGLMIKVQEAVVTILDLLKRHTNIVLSIHHH